MDLELLSKPFPEELIKERKGNWGNMLRYVETAPVITRLNEAFDGNWSFHILWPRNLSFYLLHADKLQVVGVLGELEVEGVKKQQFGVSMVTRNSETGEVVNIMDDLKAAGSDALKKCSTAFGVALYLYDSDNHNPKSDTKPKAMTEKQLKEIGRLTGELGLTYEDVEERVSEIFNKSLDDLTRDEASDIIKKMRASLNPE